MSPKRTGIRVEAGAFIDDLDKMDKKTKVMGLPVTKKVGAFIIKDAITKKPMAPKKEGTMIRSQSIETAKDMAGLDSLLVGFDTAYAARLHEAPNNWDWSLTGSGPKFLEAKINQFGNEYIKMFAKFYKVVFK